MVDDLDSSLVVPRYYTRVMTVEHDVNQLLWLATLEFGA